MDRTFASSFMFQASWYLFVAVLIISPLAFGTVEIWSLTLMEMMICLSALLLYASGKPGNYYRVPGLMPLLVICALILLQVLPLPHALAQFISPESRLIYENTFGVLAPDLWTPVTIDIRSTMMALLRFASYVLFYFLAVQLMSNPVLLKKTIFTVVGFGALLAFVVIIEFLTMNLYQVLPPDRIFWIRESLHAAGSVGPYVNRNHYAGLGEMIFPLAMALFLIYHQAVRSANSGSGLAGLLNHKHAALHLLFGAAAVLIGTSVFITFSRGGVVSLTLSMMLLAVFLTFKTGQKRIGLMLGLIFGLVLTLAGTDAWERLSSRFAQAGNIKAGRWIYWQDTLEIIKDFPILGVGMGAFEAVYAKYRTLEDYSRLEHAHNDYLELLATGGFVVSGLMLAVLIMVVFSSLRILKTRREVRALYIFAGCLAGIISILLHSTVDFNLHIGANGLYFFFIMALAVSSVNCRYQSGSVHTGLQLSSGPRFLFPAAAVCLLVGVIVINGGAMKGGLYHESLRQIRLEAQKHANIDQARFQSALSASRADRFNPVYYHLLAEVSAMGGRQEQAREYFTRALYLSPLNSRILGGAGLFMAASGNDHAAENLLSIAVEYDPRSLTPYLNHASWLFASAEVDRGKEVMKAAMVMDQKSTDICLAIMAMHGLSPAGMAGALPDLALPYFVFADYLAAMGDYESAEVAYLKALELTSGDNTAEKKHFERVSRFYQDRQQYDRALAIIIQALGYFPDDTSLIRRKNSLESHLTRTR